MIRTPFEDFDFSGKSIYPTTDEGFLTINESYQTVAQIELGIHYSDQSDDLPSDVLYTRFRVPDRDGIVWESESRFGSGILIEKMNDLSIPSQLNPYSYAEQDALAALEGKEVLRGIRYSSDDRFYRSVAIGERIIEFKFHYTMITFELAFYTHDVNHTQLYVKLCENSLFSNGDDLGAFYFATYPFLGMNTAFYNSENEWWQDNPIPSPAPFRRTSEHHSQNQNVRYG
jgi:hypothetical protein